jgi:hypothetical protein
VVTDEGELLARARREYVEGRIVVDELEAAIDHILRGGRGNTDFPYLPVFAPPAMQRILE